MPASTIDTVLACSIMIILVSSAMVATSMTLSPYLNELSHKNDVERYQQLAKYILLNPGTPSNWGSTSGVVPSSFGLALANSSQPYQLDVDKVSRLNNESVYNITYFQLHGAFGVRDVALRMEVKPLFDISVDLVSNSTVGNETTYNFGITTEKSNLPIPTRLSCYVISKNHVNNTTSSTSSGGNGTVSFTIPNSANGTALLISFAKVDTQIVAFNVYSFSHNSSVTPEPNGAFMRLSPLDYTLNVSFTYPDEQVVRTQAFSYNYTFEMTQITGDNQTAEYSVPHLLDASPMILVITGLNGSSTFAEWMSYPQLPIEVGADLSNLGAAAKIVSVTNIVSVNSVLYEFNIKFVGPQ
ncbi:MAG: hypothetical protein JSV12_01560 [Candidatus Bathyarchaeota archaeon]|nr:MAG: hypothetical protein JSV12_01560 [Candidatus Bathyarchaeota archaeon]